jgi:hypothetical protein
MISPHKAYIVANHHQITLNHHLFAGEILALFSRKHTLVDGQNAMKSQFLLVKSHETIFIGEIL